MSVPDGIVLVKLGGSLITDKRRRETFRPDVVARLAGEFAAALADGGVLAVVGHGAGSFGHAAAVRHRVGAGPIDRTGLTGVSRVQDRTARLHRRVVDALLRAGVPAFSQPPAALAVAERGRIRNWSSTPLRAAIDAGLVPVIHGDVVVDRAWRAAICSTEDAFLALSRSLVRSGRRPVRALWFGTTEGVLDDRGRPVRRVTPATASGALAHARGSEGIDVTGGMAHRVATAVALARLGIPSWIGDGTRPGILRDALAGREVPGTRIEPED